MAVYKEDLRIVKTKAALARAFFEILEVTPYEEVTVNELCEKAEVRRATFYKHFKDKSDFVTSMIREIRVRFDHEIWDREANPTITKEYYLKYADALIKYLLGREAAMMKIVSSPMRSIFIDLFMHQNYEDTKQRLEASVASGVKIASSPAVVASMLVAGTAHAIVRWFISDERCPQQELLTDIAKIIDTLLG